MSRDEPRPEPFAEDAEARMRRLSKESLSRQAYDEIKTALTRSRLKPGQKLVLRTLAADLGISATPVREALLRLVSEQALQIDDRGSVFVPVIRLERYLEIRRLRVLLEGEAGERAAVVATEAEIDELERLHARIVDAAAAGDHRQALEANERFHLTLCRLANLPVLFRIIEQLWTQAGPMLNALHARLGIFSRADHEHLTVLDGLRNRDGVKVRTAIAQDIVVGGQPVLDFLQRQEDDEVEPDGTEPVVRRIVA